MNQSNVLAEFPSWLLVLVGTSLIIAGGIAYSIPLNPFVSFALFLIVLGIIILLQSSQAFQTNNDVKLLLITIFSILLVILIDMWPLQWLYSQTAFNLLRITGVIPVQYFNPHFGGVQVLIFIHEAITMRIVGGEIDNACAGLIALVPCLVLLILADRNLEPKSNRIVIGTLAIFIIVFGNLFRIFIELWAPAVGLTPFELVHYPLAFLLGYLGIVVIAILGQLIKQPEKPLNVK